MHSGKTGQQLDLKRRQHEKPHQITMPLEEPLSFFSPDMYCSAQMMLIRSRRSPALGEQRCVFPGRGSRLSHLTASKAQAPSWLPLSSVMFVHCVMFLDLEVYYLIMKLP